MSLSKDFLLILIWEKWFLCYSCNPDKNKILSQLHNISKVLDDLSKEYDNFMLLSDFTNEPEGKSMSNFLNTYLLKTIETGQTKDLFQKPR